MTIFNGSEEKKEEKEKEREEKTEVLYGIENAVSKGIQFMQDANKWMDLYGDKNGPSIIVEFPDIYKNNYIAAKRRGAKIRFITEITKDNIHYCKELMKIVTELRHLDGLVGGIAVSESEYMTTTTLRRRQLLTQVFYSNAHEVVKQGQYVFNTFWNKAIPAKQRIKEIEQDLKREFIEPIRDPVEIQSLVSKVITSALEEIDIIFSTPNSFKRYEKEGIIELLARKADDGIKVRILLNQNNDIRQSIRLLRKKHPRITIRGLDKSIKTKLTTIMADQELSLVIELKDDTQYDSNEAIGLATYSNSESTVLSYASIFETLWIQDARLATVNKEITSK